MAQQRISIATQYLNMGFDVKLKSSGDVDMMEAEFLVAGEAVPQAQMQGEQQAIGLQQAEMQLQQAIQQQERQEQQQAMMGGGAPEEGEMAPEEGGEGEGEGEDLQLMEKSIPASERKFKGRMGGTTPDHTDKAGGTDEERDPEEYAEARAKAAEERDMGIKKGTTWIGDLISRGYSAPLIKEVTPDGTQMWFSQDGIDYVAKLGALGISDIEKATFTRTKSTEDNKKQKPQETSIMNNDDDEDDERA